MFFARIVVAALSFGSLAQVFAAPIKVDTSSVSGETTVSDPGLTRRDVVTFVSSLANVKDAARDALSSSSALNVDSVLVSGLTKVDSELGIVTGILTGAGVDANSLLKDVDGITALSMSDVAGKATSALEAVGELIANVESLGAVSVAKTELDNIKAKLTGIQAALSSVAPELHALINSVLVFVLGTTNELLKSVGVTI